MYLLNDVRPREINMPHAFVFSQMLGRSCTMRIAQCLAISVVILIAALKQQTNNPTMNLPDSCLMLQAPGLELLSTGGSSKRCCQFPPWSKSLQSPPCVPVATCVMASLPSLQLLFESVR
ncbi:unnamed protein product, partial [Durusdinium trenchii]